MKTEKSDIADIINISNDIAEKIRQHDYEASNIFKKRVREIIETKNKNSLESLEKSLSLYEKDGLEVGKLKNILRYYITNYRIN